MISIIKKPSAWIPIVMSLTVIAIEIFYFTKFAIAHQPIVRETDEGTGAHLFQIFMAGQFPIIAFFAIKWLPEKPKQALRVLGLQFIAGVAACAPVFYFKL